MRLQGCTNRGALAPAPLHHNWPPSQYENLEVCAMSLATAPGEAVNSQRFECVRDSVHRDYRRMFRHGRPAELPGQSREPPTRHVRCVGAHAKKSRSVYEKWHRGTGETSRAVDQQSPKPCGAVREKIQCLKRLDH